MSKLPLKEYQSLEQAVAEEVSPQELRHAHASHAMDRGAPIYKRQG